MVELERVRKPNANKYAARLDLLMYAGGHRPHTYGGGEWRCHTSILAMYHHVWP